MTVQMPYQPDENEQAVLDVLKREHRVNPLRIREQTDIRKQYVNDALSQLQKAELVEKVTGGLYEYAGDDAPVRLEPEDVAELISILEDCNQAIDAEYNSGHHEARAWADRLREELGDG